MNVNDVRVVFEEDLGEQAAEALQRALDECEVTEGFRLELGLWKLEAEIVWHTGQCPAWEVWKGWACPVPRKGYRACFRVHPEKGPEPFLPLLSVVVEEGKVTFPNLDRMVQGICRATR